MAPSQSDEAGNPVAKTIKRNKQRTKKRKAQSTVHGNIMRIAGSLNLCGTKEKPFLAENFDDSMREKIYQKFQEKGRLEAAPVGREDSAVIECQYAFSEDYNQWQEPQDNQVVLQGTKSPNPDEDILSEEFPTDYCSIDKLTAEEIDSLLGEPTSNEQLLKLFNEGPKLKRVRIKQKESKIVDDYIKKIPLEIPCAKKPKNDRKRKLNEGTQDQAIKKLAVSESLTEAEAHSDDPLSHSPSTGKTDMPEAPNDAHQSAQEMLNTLRVADAFLITTRMQQMIKEGQIAPDMSFAEFLVRNSEGILRSSSSSTESKVGVDGSGSEVSDEANSNASSSQKKQEKLEEKHMFDKSAEEPQRVPKKNEGMLVENVSAESSGSSRSSSVESAEELKEQSAADGFCEPTQLPALPEVPKKFGEENSMLEDHTSVDEEMEDEQVLSGNTSSDYSTSTDVPAAQEVQIMTNRPINTKEDIHGQNVQIDTSVDTPSMVEEQITVNQRNSAEQLLSGSPSCSTETPALQEDYEMSEEPMSTNQDKPVGKILVSDEQNIAEDEMLTEQTSSREDFDYPAVFSAPQEEQQMWNKSLEDILMSDDQNFADAETSFEQDSFKTSAIHSSVPSLQKDASAPQDQQQAPENTASLHEHIPFNAQQPLAPSTLKNIKKEPKTSAPESPSSDGVPAGPEPEAGSQKSRASCRAVRLAESDAKEKKRKEKERQKKAEKAEQDRKERALEAEREKERIEAMKQKAAEAAKLKAQENAKRMAAMEKQAEAEQPEVIVIKREVPEVAEQETETIVIRRPKQFPAVEYLLVIPDGKTVDYYEWKVIDWINWVHIILEGEIAHRVAECIERDALHGVFFDKLLQNETEARERLKIPSDHFWHLKGYAAAVYNFFHWEVYTQKAAEISNQNFN